MADRRDVLIKTVRAVVRGRVQGVGYRAWTRREGDRRGLSGWVRNRRDGCVEMVLHGDSAIVDDMLAALRDGPPAAVVTAVEIAIVKAPVAGGFEVWPTA